MSLNACAFLKLKLLAVILPAGWVKLFTAVGQNRRTVKMWIQVRSMDGQKNVRIDDLSKLTKIEDLREKLVTHFNADPERQRLFFRGKQVSCFISL